ncbi:MAG: MerR family transcriptional regulator [Dermatophilaceae bacterium]
MHSVSSAARLCGVSPSTLRAWERRYGVVEPIRTEGGYRVYDDAALRRLTRMSSLIASGWSPRHAAAYVMNDGDGEGAPLPVVTEEVRPDPVPPTPEEEAEHIEVILQAAEALDAPRVSDELDFAFSIHSFDDLVDIWLGPILVATGKAWAEGRLSVAGEHFLSAGIERRLAKAFDEASHTRVTGPRVVIGTPRGSRHTIGSFAFATSLRRNGCDVTYLGADVPPDAWLHAVTSRSADIVCVSVPTNGDAVAAGETVALLAESHAELRIYVGGSGHSGVVASAAIHLDGTVSESAKRILADHAEATGASPEAPEPEAASGSEGQSAEATATESTREPASA